MNIILVCILLYLVLSYIVNYIILRTLDYITNTLSITRATDRYEAIELFYWSPITIPITLILTLFVIFDILRQYIFPSAYKTFLSVKEKFEDLLFPIKN